MNRRILVADDSSIIQKVIKIALARFHFRIEEAASFIEALTSVSHAPVDVLIIDASLPGARGPEDFARLAAAANQAPLILLVGSFESFDEGAFRAVGCQHILKKPFESSEIVALITSLLDGGLDAVTPPPPPGPNLGASSQEAGGLGLGGPIVPPFPGAESRARHSTVFQVPPPPPPHNPPAPPTPRAGQNNMSRMAPAMPPPPRPSMIERFAAPGPDEGVDDEPQVSDNDAPPFSLRLPQDPTFAPEPLATDAARRGRRAFAMADTDPRSGELPPGPARDEPRSGRPRSASRPQPPPPPALAIDLNEGGRDDNGEGGGERTDPSRPAADQESLLDINDINDISASLRSRLEAQLPALVRQALEDYCERHFKSLAREVIANELRRLADEKARHLVDN